RERKRGRERGRKREKGGERERGRERSRWSRRVKEREREREREREKELQWGLLSGPVSQLIACLTASQDQTVRPGVHTSGRPYQLLISYSSDRVLDLTLNVIG